MHRFSRACSGLWLALFALSAAAQTQTGGAITTDTIWHAAQGPYVVTSDILVQNGATLTIEAGTTVYMGAATAFTMQSGTLKAVGTVQDPIRITSHKLQNSQAPAPGDWQQFTIEAGVNSATRLEHVHIEYGKGVVINGAAPTLNYLTVKYHQGAAITADLSASPKGVGNQAIGNDINAIVVPAGDISGAVTWGVRGIPYLVQWGRVSVGASPRINTVTPNSLQQAETQTITLSGFRLSGLAQPIFDLAGLSAQVLEGTTDTQAKLQVTAAAGAALGSANLLAQTDAGEVRSQNALTVVPTQPKLTSVTPSSLAVGQGDATITLKGRNFSNQSAAYLDMVALATTYVNATEISAVVPNQTGSAVKAVRLRTPNPPGGPEYVSNDLALSVIVPPPVVTSITPNAIRRGETNSFRIAGTGLNTVALSVSGSGLSISDLALSPGEASFNLTAAANASLGAQQLTLTNSAGSASAALTVNPALPSASLAPTPIAVPPDNSSRQFAVQLSFADTVSHTFSVAVGDPTIVSTSSSTLTIAAGQVQAVGSIVGLKAGVTSLTLVSPALGTLSVPIYVTSDFIGLNTSNAPLLGVVLTPPPQPPAQNTVSPVSSALGVVLGSVVQNVSPRALSIGGGARTVTISGTGLQGATSIAVKPAQGITVGSMSVAPDGRSITVPLTVSGDASVTQRQIVVLSATGQPYPAAKPEADRILITLPIPEIHSIEPVVGTPGTSSMSFLIRGRNLQAAESVNVLPAEGITFGSAFTVSPDGTQLTVGAAIAQSAPLGQRVVTVTTPAGTSDATASEANVFRVVNQVVGDVTPVASPVLGIVKQDSGSTTRTEGIVARELGVALGSAAVSMSPTAKAIGETFTLSVHGAGLQGVTSVAFVPATGLTVGTPAVAADGRSLTVPVSISTDAPQTTRALKLFAGAAPVHFALPEAAVFNVTAVVPSVESTEPIVLQLGAAPVVMTIRGKNFQNAQEVRFEPADGITASIPPVVDAAGTQLTVNVSAAANAAPGARAVIVTTPGGASSAERTAANTVTLAANVSPAGPVAAPLLGIVKQDAASPVTTVQGPIAAADLGVVFGQIATPPVGSSAFSGPLGVLLGPVASSVEPKAFAAPGTGILAVRGVSLGNVSAVSVRPPQGVTIGSPLEIAPDGSQLTVPISIAADAAPTVRTVVLSDAAGKTAFSHAAGATFAIHPDTVPGFSSISPILSTTGSLVTLTINGHNLQNAIAVTASPGEGLAFDAQPVVNGDGTQLTVRMQIAGDAPLGSRVIQVITPVNSSSAAASPANTFTVYAP